MSRITITDLGGSLNQGKAPSALDENEYTSLQNFYQFGNKLIRRGGMRFLNSSDMSAASAGISTRLTGIFSYRPSVSVTGGLDVALGKITKFSKLVGNTISDLPSQPGFVINGSAALWVMFQYKDIWYGLREGAGLVRSDGTYYGPSGIAAPSGAATLAQGASGAIPAGDFKGVYTFYNRNTNMESNPSPVSNLLSLAASKKIDWSGIGTSGNVQVNARRLYRTLAGQSGEYFFVAQLDDNVTTTFTGDNVLAQDVGSRASFNNGTPPDGLIIGDVWKERLFASDGVDLFHSEDGLIEAFDSDSVIPVFPDDGHRLSAIHAWGDRLAIGKTNKIHYLVGNDPRFTLLTLSDRHGCVAHHTMQSAEGFLFWLGLDNVYRSDGNAVTGIASVKLRDTIEGMDALAAKSAFATVLPKLGWYLLSIPGYVQLIYNYRTDVWCEIPTNTDIYCFGDIFDSNNVQSIYASDANGGLYVFNDDSHGYDDSVVAMALVHNTITATLDSRAFGADTATKHVVARVALLCDRYAESIALAIVSENAVMKQRIVSLDYDPRWKLYNLSTRHQAKAQSQLRVTYSGTTPIELEGFALDLEPIGRPSMMPR